MRVIVRPASRADTRQMAEIAGPPVTAKTLGEWMAGDSARAAWHLVEDDAGRVLGFQHIGRSETLPPDACVIATFLRPGPLPAGAAATLFETTAETARRLRYAWISAAVAGENDGARTYYQSRGFRLYADSGTQVFLRYDLD